MASKQHPHGYWTEERILSVAKNYEYKEDFRQNKKKFILRHSAWVYCKKQLSI